MLYGGRQLEIHVRYQLAYGLWDVFGCGLQDVGCRRSRSCPVPHLAVLLIFALDRLGPLRHCAAVLPCSNDYVDTDYDGDS